MVVLSGLKLYGSKPPLCNGLLIHVWTAAQTDIQGKSTLESYIFFTPLNNVSYINLSSSLDQPSITVYFSWRPSGYTKQLLV